MQASNSFSKSTNEILEEGGKMPFVIPNCSSTTGNVNRSEVPTFNHQSTSTVNTNNKPQMDGGGGVPATIQESQSVVPSSLYVGDLHPDATESDLFDMFSRIGQVLSIRLCRDAITRRSLGYAYVNFKEHNEAEEALKTLNFQSLIGCPVRIMWSQRDPSIRRTGAGNVFIKNLASNIDTKALYDAFSLFGNILSCKVVIDACGNSKGYGFVHFDSEQSALDAISKVNGMVFEGQELFVTKFISRQQRQKERENLVVASAAAQHFNFDQLVVHVSNFGDALDARKLHNIFSKFGQVLETKVVIDTCGNSKGYGFVHFDSEQSALDAISKVNGMVFEGQELFVTKFISRQQRQKERNNMVGAGAHKL